MGLLYEWEVMFLKSQYEEIKLGKNRMNRSNINISGSIYIYICMSVLPSSLEMEELNYICISCTLFFDMVSL